MTDSGGYQYPSDTLWANMSNTPFHQMPPVCMSQCHNIHSFFPFTVSQISSTSSFIESYNNIHTYDIVDRYKPHFCAVILYLSSHRIIVHTHLSRSSHRISISIVLYFTLTSIKIVLFVRYPVLNSYSLHPLLPANVVSSLGTL